MEKMELYRKYRPNTLEDMVGNEATIKSLKKEMENGSHVFLMTGPAGCGKTTLARIMAKEVGAGPLSIHEINSAENRGIDTAREVMEDMRFNPSDGDAIVWIFDECHQWLGPVQNAFLKALEDTPDHCYFFLCTTDPQKLIEPLKSRCSIINVKPLSDDEMTYLLKRTARAEKIKVGAEVYERICEIAQGGSRKGLKLLAKVLYLDTDEERLEVLKAGEDNETKESIELCRALTKKTNIKTLFSLLKEIDISDPEKVRQGIMGYMNACLLKGGPSPEIIATLQAFSSADTYRNGKVALSVAILDREDLLG
jgi:DNA polymerase-3 subunit gamma/tau